MRNVNFDSIKSLMKSDLDINLNQIKEEGMPLLWLAAKEKDIEMINLLLDRGANVNLVSCYGETALMRAAQEGHIEIVKLLLDRGADVNYVDYVSKTALMYAVKGGHIEIVKLLLDKSAGVNNMDSIGKTVLKYAVEGGHVEIVKLLLDRGADVNYMGYDRKTALRNAAEEGHTEIVRLLLDKGTCSPDNHDKKNVLHYAFNKQYYGIMKEFIIADAFAYENLSELFSNVGHIMSHASEIEKITVLANLINKFFGQEELSFMFLKQVSKVKNFFEDKVLDKWEQLKLCREIQELKSKTKLNDFNKACLQDLWDQIDVLLPRLDKGYKHCLNILDIKNDLAQDLGGYLSDEDKIKIFNSISEDSMLSILHSLNMQELKDQISAIERKVEKISHKSITPEMDQEITTNFDQNTLEEFLRRAKNILKTDAINLAEADDFIRVSKAFINNDLVHKNQNSPYETLSSICEKILVEEVELVGDDFSNTEGCI